MKKPFLALFSAAALLPALPIHAQTPFVETTTLTFYWGLTNDYVTNAFTSIPTLPELVVFDPDALPTGVETYTDTLTPRSYTGSPYGKFAPALANQQIVQLLLQRMLRNGTLSKEELEYRWQLTAVREAPRTVKELATNPYRVFLTGQASNSSKSSPIVEATTYGAEVVSDDPILPSYLDSSPTFPSTVTVDTGINITLGQFTGNYNETLWNNSETIVLNASGTATTAFTVDFGALFYDDPRHAQSEPKNDPTFNYHLIRNYWQASASGVINYGVSTIKAPLPTFVATKVTASATGWFYHDHTEIEYVNNFPRYKLRPASYGGAGIAPLRVTLSNIQYQKRTLFNLAVPSAPSNLSTVTIDDEGLFTEPNAEAIVLTWTDNARNETHHILERLREDSDVWEVVPRVEASGFGTGSFTIRDLVQDTSYTFRIRAANGGGISGYSPTVQGTTVAKPTLLDVASATPGIVNLTWSDNSNTETGYVLERQREGSNTWQTLPVIGPNVTTYQDTGLIQDQTYTYRLRAQDGTVGFSAYSDTTSIKVPKAATN